MLEDEAISKTRHRQKKLVKDQTGDGKTTVALCLCWYANLPYDFRHPIFYVVVTKATPSCQLACKQILFCCGPSLDAVASESVYLGIPGGSHPKMPVLIWSCCFNWMVQVFCHMSHRQLLPWNLNLIHSPLERFSVSEILRKLTDFSMACQIPQART